MSPDKTSLTRFSAQWIVGGIAIKWANPNPEIFPHKPETV